LFLYSTFFSLFCAADALSAANARISSLEAELKAFRKAFDAAATAKTAPEKSTKSALARAKKAEKALSDANQSRIQREKAVTERLNKISALAGGKYHTFSLLLLVCPFSYLLTYAFLFSVFVLFVL
jgi:septal ring factor EnvC (AmiA/AmiB activator)